MGNEENDCLIFMENEFGVYSLCGAEEEGTITLGSDWCEDAEGEAVFAVDFTKTMIGAAGTYVIEYDAYALHDYGVLREQIYPGACDPSIDPAIKVGDLEWFFDIIPNNGVQAVDLDNDVALWLSGNPNFDGCDDLSIYSPFNAVAFGAALVADSPVTDDVVGTSCNFGDYDAALTWNATMAYLSTYYAIGPVTYTYYDGDTCVSFDS
jgi:hypothetical protein